jgi:DNA-binding NarL/FixJ family response regulator
MKVLFVDDDPLALEALQNILHGDRDRWELTFAAGADEALDALGDGAVHLVVSDMHMPDKDGAALLSEVRARQPDAMRFVLSGASDRASVLHAFGVAHHFLRKPCAPGLLRDTIARALELQSLLVTPAVKEIVDGMTLLPPPPAFFRTLLSPLVEPAPFPLTVHDVLGKEPCLIERLLQLIDSPGALYDSAARSMDRSALWFGFELATTLELMNYALTALGSVNGGRGRWERERRTHAIAVAIVARAVAPQPALARDAFCAGLLHDLGDFARDDGGDDRHRGSPLHAALGARLLAHWGVPFTVLEGVAFHHEPEGQSPGELTVAGAVHIADVLVSRADGSCFSGKDADLRYAESLGLGPKLDDWQNLAASIVEPLRVAPVRSVPVSAA